MLSSKICQRITASGFAYRYSNLYTSHWQPSALDCTVRAVP